MRFAAGDATVKIAGRATLPLPEAAKQAVMVTLEKMAKGGIYDHLAGGFHRYSVDERWVVPHFEKMAYDNSELLKNYVHAFQAFGERSSRGWRGRSMRWMDEWLSDRERAGSMRRRMRTFRWTTMATTLPGRGTRRRGADGGGAGVRGAVLRHRRDRRHAPQCGEERAACEAGLEAVARKAGMSVEAAREAAGVGEAEAVCGAAEAADALCGQDDLCGWNAMCISAYLEAGRVLEVAGGAEFALKSLDRVLSSAWKRAAMERPGWRMWWPTA
jgi:uncharacterized protein YyaL (SSP411 family)